LGNARCPLRLLQAGRAKPRTRPSPATTPTGPVAASIARSLPPPRLPSPPPPPPQTHPPSPEQKHPKPETEITTDETQSIEAPLHSHRILRQRIPPTPPPSPLNVNSESPIEFFVDDEDFSTHTHSLRLSARFAREPQRWVGRSGFRECECELGIDVVLWEYVAQATAHAVTLV